MKGEDEFTPKLGRQKARSRKNRLARSSLGQIVAAAARAGPRQASGRSRFNGGRLGRGAAVGRLLASRGAQRRPSDRRVIVKMRLVRLRMGGIRAARLHLAYLQRDGVTRGGEAGRLYDKADRPVDGANFLDRASADRHQFRFIVSAEDGDQYHDLKPLVRRLMRQMEADLGTSLEWVAVDHYDTARPHSHVMLRGTDDRGDNLVIARDYIRYGLRERAAELVRLDLGPRLSLEIEARDRHDIGAERLTAIDRHMMREMGEDSELSVDMHDPVEQALRLGRLGKLEAMGLARKESGGRWRLRHDLDDRLQRIEERNLALQTMQHEIAARGLIANDQRIYEPADPHAQPLVGRLIAQGLADDVSDHHYLLVDGVDGRSHYVGIGRISPLEAMPDGAVVEVRPRTAQPRLIDRVVVTVAEANAGRYSIDRHLDHDPAMTDERAGIYARRVEAIRQGVGGVERLPDGDWQIGADHLERAAKFEAGLLRDRPVAVSLLSSRPLQELVQADAATWLDRRLVGQERAEARNIGFGAEVRQAEMLRRQWLIEQDLADEKGGQISPRKGALQVLQRREMLQVASQLSDELGLDFVEAEKTTRIEGVLLRKVDLVSGRFGLVAGADEFTLVPWRRTLGRELGRSVSGMMREDGLSFTLGRGRSGLSM
jgi:type IV secretory pathway VirD2 relaxase